MSREALKKELCESVDSMSDAEVEAFLRDGSLVFEEEQGVAEELIKINGEFKKLTKVVQKLEESKKSDIKEIKPYIDMYKFMMNSIDSLEAMPNPNYINLFKFNTQFGSFKRAYTTVAKRYKEILQEIDLQPVASVGELFDPQTQEAVEVVSDGNATRENEIVEVIEQGFLYNGELLQYAQVAVSQ